MGIWLNMAVYTAIGITALVVLVSLFRTGSPFRYLFGSFIEGVCAIAAVNVVGIFTGLSLGFGWFTLVASAVFGIPGVVSVLLMRVITLV